MESDGALMGDSSEESKISDKEQHEKRLQEIVDFLNLLNEDDRLIVLISGKQSETVEVKDIYLHQDNLSTLNYLVLTLYPPLSEEKKDQIRRLAQEKKEHEA